jgi:hypothetical protein
MLKTDLRLVMPFTISIKLAGICLFRISTPFVLDGSAVTCKTTNAAVTEKINHMLYKLLVREAAATQVEVICRCIEG